VVLVVVDVVLVVLVGDVVLVVDVVVLVVDVVVEVVDVVVEVVDVVVEVDEVLVLLELVVDVVVCDPQLDPLYTAYIVVGLVIDTGAGSAVLPVIPSPDQWLKVHDP
jgi:hypothetical protein